MASRQDTGKPALNSRALSLIGLHVLLFVLSLSGFFSKTASQQEFFSVPFFAFYAGMLFILGVYAIGWQQVIKRLPLTLAFANKAVTVVWGILWGAVFFGEQVTPLMLVGAAVVIAGVVLFAYADKEVQEQDAARKGAGGDVSAHDAPEAGGDAA